MRKLMIAAFAAAALIPAGTATAATAGPDLPSIPTNCHELNDLLGIDNVRSCDGA
jgi:hypothetical protein